MSPVAPVIAIMIPVANRTDASVQTFPKRVPVPFETHRFGDEPQDVPSMLSASLALSCPHLYTYKRSFSGDLRSIFNARERNRLPCARISGAAC